MAEQTGNGYLNYPVITEFNSFFYQNIKYVIPVIIGVILIYLIIRKVTDFIYLHKNIFFRKRKGCRNEWYENEELKRYLAFLDRQDNMAETEEDTEKASKEDSLTIFSPDDGD